ncbi:MAG: hypothetical protein HY880_08005 [Deltaproteobacteria bacterium]|nr:hypothetical protein [Deltaproteobacteria bacterium]
MAEDILVILKEKEAEMEVLLEDARLCAVWIKEEAGKKAQRLWQEALRETEKILEAMRMEHEARLQIELEKIREDALREVQGLRRSGLKKKEAAIMIAQRYLLEGFGDKGDDQGPDNRTKDTSR